MQSSRKLRKNEGSLHSGNLPSTFHTGRQDHLPEAILTGQINPTTAIILRRTGQKKRNINFSDPAQLYGVVITGKTVWTVLAGSAFSGSICWSPARLWSNFSSAVALFAFFLQLYAQNQIFLCEGELVTAYSVANSGMRW